LLHHHHHVTAASADTSAENPISRQVDRLFVVRDQQLSVVACLSFAKKKILLRHLFTRIMVDVFSVVKGKDGRSDPVIMTLTISKALFPGLSMGHFYLSHSHPIAIYACLTPSHSIGFP